MAFPDVSAILSYAPEAALLLMESLEILLQDDASSYPTYIPGFN